MASLRLALLLFPLFCAVHLGQSDFDGFETPDKLLLKRVFVATEKLLAFFKSDYSQINLDGLFGLRAGQGQLIGALQELEDKLDFDILHRLEVLTEEVDFTCEQALPYAQSQDEDYFERFISTVDEPYLLPYEPRLFSRPENYTKQDPPVNTRSYDEDAGDVCLSKILGTFIHDDKPVPKCTTDEDCYEMMTKEGEAGYTITHQLIYFIFGEKMDCREELRHISGEDIEISQIETRMCKDIYLQAMALEEDGDVSPLDQDLFMEQITVCGVLGFENFIRADWMKMVLRWQNAEGCFAMQMTENQKTLARALQRKNKRNAKKLDTEKREEMCEATPGGRKLLREFPMRDGCLAHKSGLGFSTLSTFLRHLLRLLAEGDLN